MKQLLQFSRAPKSATSALLLISLLLSSTGCSFRKGERWKFAGWDIRKAVGMAPSKPAPETPTRLVTTWTEAVLNRPGETPQRGFGGRLAFFKNGNEDPVRVEGQLVIYAFDESGDDPYKTEPTKRYIFPADQLAVYESESTVGPTYNIWLPWDEAGGVERKVSLIARFEPKDGAIVVGEQTRHLLSGTSPAGAARQQMASTIQPGPSHLELARYQAPAPTANGAQAGGLPMGAEHSVMTAPAPDPLTTTSIPLPRKLPATPGPSLLASRAQQQAIAAARMPAFTSMSTAPTQSSGPVQTASGINAVQPLQPATQQSFAAQAVWQTPVGTSAGYLPPTAPAPGSVHRRHSAVESAAPGQPPSTGFQSPLPRAPEQPFGQ
jgi:hypothetical protein